MMEGTGSIYEALTGESDPGVVDVFIRPKGGRTTKWEVACQGCGYKANAKTRTLAKAAARIHTVAAHDGARARVRIRDPRRA